MKLTKIIKKSVRKLLEEQEFPNLVDNYTFDKQTLYPLIKNARKWQIDNFVEEYVDLNDITIYWGDSYFSNSISKGDTVILARKVRGKNGNVVNRKYSFYKKVVSNKDYGTNHWDFIMDNTKEIQDEAIKLYHENKHNIKPRFNKTDKTIKGYHASPKKFKQFKYGEHSESGQLGANYGFFFFKEKKYAENYCGVIKHYNKKAYLYECTIRLGKFDTWKGEDVGTNWGRAGDLEQAEIEGYDMVIIQDADTGYGVTDEIVVFDDDNIKIDKITKL